jgi:hypothetical protein
MSRQKRNVRVVATALAAGTMLWAAAAPAAAVIDATAPQYGATPDQAAVGPNAARSTMCTQAPG